MEKIERNSSNNLIISSLKGGLIGVCISLGLILIFAFIIKMSYLSDIVIKIINQIIKALSIFSGTLFTIRKTKEKGLLTGLFIGVIYSLLAFLVFSILNGGFSFDITLLIDTLFASVMGLICGVVCISLVK